MLLVRADLLFLKSVGLGCRLGGVGPGAYCLASRRFPTLLFKSELMILGKTPDGFHRAKKSAEIPDCGKIRFAVGRAHWLRSFHLLCVLQFFRYAHCVLAKNMLSVCCFRLD